MKLAFPIGNRCLRSEFAILDQLRQQGWHGGFWVNAYGNELRPAWFPGPASGPLARSAHRLGQWRSSTSCGPSTAGSSRAFRRLRLARTLTSAMSGCRKHLPVGVWAGEYGTCLDRGWARRSNHDCGGTAGLVASRRDLDRVGQGTRPRSVGRGRSPDSECAPQATTMPLLPPKASSTGSKRSSTALE